MTKQTFQPNTKKKKRKVGFLARMASVGGRKVIKARRSRGRKKLSA